MNTFIPTTCALALCIASGDLRATGRAGLDLDVRITHVDRTGSDVRVWVEAPGGYTLTWSDGSHERYRKHLVGAYTVTVVSARGQIAKCHVIGVTRVKGTRLNVCRKPGVEYWITLPNGERCSSEYLCDREFRRRVQVGDPPYVDVAPISGQGGVLVYEHKVPRTADSRRIVVSSAAPKRVISGNR